MTRSELCQAVGFPVDEAAFARLSRFVAALLDENTRINLTAIRTPERVWSLHVCDSLALVPHVRAALATRDAQAAPNETDARDELKSARVVDIGTGGGAPGIPLACVMPEISFLLVDSTRKKIEAVQRIAGSVGAQNVAAIWGRSEQLSREARYRSTADAAVARAVAEVDELIQITADWLRPGGRALFMKSANAVEAEVAQATARARRSGLALRSVERYTLPEPHGERAIAIYERREAR